MAEMQGERGDNVLSGTLCGDLNDSEVHPSFRASRKQSACYVLVHAKHRLQLIGWLRRTVKRQIAGELLECAGY